MSESYNGEISNFALAGSNMDVVMYPDGEFEYYQTSVANATKKDESDARKYLTSKAAKDALGEDFTPGRMVKVGRTRVKTMTEKQVVAYWTWKASNGSVEAKALLAALAAEALYRRANIAFGIKVAEEQVEQRTATIRLNLIEQAKAPYLVGNKDGMYSTLSAAETEIALLMVSIERLKLTVYYLDPGA